MLSHPHASYVLEKLAHGILITDVADKVVYLNNRAGAILGVPLEQVLGQSIDAMLFGVAPREVKFGMGWTGTIGAGSFTLQIPDQNMGLRSIEVRAVPLSEDIDANGGDLYELRDVSESLQRTQQLLYDASHDSLTGLANRRALIERLNQVLQWESEPGAESVLALIDLDGFKQINDSIGHVAGDDVLRDIAQLLQANVRKADMAARLGGDEFVILLVSCGMTEACRIVENIRKLIGTYQYRFYNVDYGVTASVGLSRLDVEVRSVTQVLQSADQACYRAKDAGGNRIKYPGRHSRRQEQ
ncbi:MAG: diguanylate cyclase [Chromatocurvus sp.]